MRIFGFLILLFTVIPVAELYLLFYVGGKIGGWETFSIVIVTGVVGAALARQEGALAWRRVQQALEAGKLPGKELVDALLILVSGAMLLTPGFMTDILGFSMLIPWTRSLARSLVMKRFKHSMAKGTIHFGGMNNMRPPGADDPRRGQRRQADSDDIIDVTAESADDDDERSGRDEGQPR